MSTNSTSSSDDAVPPPPPPPHTRLASIGETEVAHVIQHSSTVDDDDDHRVLSLGPLTASSTPEQQQQRGTTTTDASRRSTLYQPEESLRRAVSVANHTLDDFLSSPSFTGVKSMNNGKQQPQPRNTIGAASFDTTGDESFSNISGSFYYGEMSDDIRQLEESQNELRKFLDETQSEDVLKAITSAASMMSEEEELMAKRALGIEEESGRGASSEQSSRGWRIHDLWASLDSNLRQELVQRAATNNGMR